VGSGTRPVQTQLLKKKKCPWAGRSFPHAGGRFPVVKAFPKADLQCFCETRKRVISALGANERRLILHSASPQEAHIICNSRLAGSNYPFSGIT
jgi:hypothetical protein